MELKKITKYELNEVYEKMKKAFPYEEIRDFADEEKCFLKKEFRIYDICENGESSGFVAVWVFEKFVFIEHLATDSEKRSRGIGTKCVEKLKEMFNLPIILEAEAPETEQQIKRIRFYDRLGFKVNDFMYEQPSYHGGEGVPLLILSFPARLTQNEFDFFIKETRRSVYFSNTIQ